MKLPEVIGTHFFESIPLACCAVEDCWLIAAPWTEGDNSSTVRFSVRVLWLEQILTESSGSVMYPSWHPRCVLKSIIATHGNGKSIMSYLGWCANAFYSALCLSAAWVEPISNSLFSRLLCPSPNSSRCLCVSHDFPAVPFLGVSDGNLTNFLSWMSFCYPAIIECGRKKYTHMLLSPCNWFK